MYRTGISSALVLLACLADCRSSSGDTNPRVNTDCSATLSGAITGRTSCNATATYARNRLGVSDLSILNTGDLKFNIGISKTGQLAAGSITESSSGVTMAVTTASSGSLASGGLLWSQSTQDPAHGSVAVNLTSVSLASDGYTFTVHGTADATLTPSPATPSATGTVKVHVDF